MTITYAQVDATAGTGNLTLVPAPGSGSRLNIYAVEAAPGGSTTAYLLSGSTELWGGSNSPRTISTSVGIKIDPLPWEMGPRFICGDNEAFIVNRGDSQTWTATVWYSVSSA